MIRLRTAGSIVGFVDCKMYAKYNGDVCGCGTGKRGDSGCSAQENEEKEAIRRQTRGLNSDRHAFSRIRTNLLIQIKAYLQIPKFASAVNSSSKN